MASLANKSISEEAILTEWEEIKAAQQSAAAFRPLYDRYYEALFRFIYKRTADQNLTADLTQQVFLKVMQNITSYQFKGLPFSAWLYRIATNEVLQYFRQHQKARIICIEDTNVSDIQEAIHDDQEAIQQDIGVMENAIRELSEHEIQLLEMRFFEKRSFKEVGDILNITENNAKVKTYRLLDKLKQLMSKKNK